jgi:two-component system, sensor histidine kinase LadS
MPHFKLMTNLKNLVGKCIRYAISPLFKAFRRVLGMCVLGSVLLLSAAGAEAQPTILLTDDSPMQDISAASLMWVDTKGQRSVTQVVEARSSLAFTPTKAEAVYKLGRDAALWQHYRFAVQGTPKERWVLEFPQPLLDRITVYQSSAAGKWTQLTAGDTVPVADWPTPGRYAQFNLDIDKSGVHDVYVQIRNVANISIPVRVSTHGYQTQRLQFEYLVVGIVFGTLLLLIITCIAQSWAYRDHTYGWYAAYAMILMLTMSAWTGVAGHLLWNHSGTWADLAPGCLGVLTGSSALLFINHVCGANPRKKWFEPVLLAFGLAGVPVAIAYAVLERSTAVSMISGFLITVATLGIIKAVTTWRRKDVIGLWVLAAFTPTALATVLLITNVMGFVPSSWLTRYGLMIGLIVEVPLLLVALNIRSRERHGVEARAQTMPTQDALTGLLTGHLFQDRLRQMVVRTKRYKEPAAVVYIQLVNYGYIKKTWGVAVAEQSLLRSVIKLRRILRDVDTVGRVDEAVFGLILEGVSDRSAVTALAARLIAAGLMPLKGLKPEVVLQFHVVSVLLSERPGSALDTHNALTETLQNMGSRTRRPIRFLEPELTMPMPFEAQSEFEPDQTDPGKRSAQQANYSI